MTKKLLSALTAAAMLCTMMAMSADAVEKSGEYTSGDYKYIILADDTVKITNYTAYSDETKTCVTIPNQIDGRTVTAIGDSAFAPPFTTVETEDTIKYDYEKSVIKTVVIPDTVTELGIRVFGHCTELQQVKLPPNIKSLHGAFADCENLNNVIIPASVEEYCGDFSGCKNLSEVKVEGANQYLKSKDNLIYTKDGETLLCVPQGIKGNITVAKKTKIIANAAFGETTNLNSVILPKGVEKIGQNAFFLSGADHIEIPATVNTIEEFAFGHSNIKTVVLPKGIKLVKYMAFAGCKNLRSVTIGDKIKFEDDAFMDCPKLKIYRIGKKVKFNEYCFGWTDDELDTFKNVKFYGYKGTSAEKIAKSINRMKYTNKIKFIPLTAMKKAKVKGVTAKKYNKAVKKSGARQKIKVYVKKKLLKKGRDYTVSYQNNKKRGKAKIIITGINKYDGIVKRSFKIK